MLETAQIKAFFTGRTDGVSPAPYAACNLGLHVGDEEAHVIANRERIAATYNLPLDTWVAGEQVHGSTVTVVTEEMRGRGARALADMLPATDALITNVSNITLTTYAADCVPLLFADADRLAIGAAHAGWKGTVAKIAARTVEAMHKTYGTDPASLRVQIGPSIGPCCYEVDDRVADAVRESFGERAKRLLTPNANGRWQFDLWTANVLTLEEAGVPRERIERLDACTSCQNRRYFSYRKEGGNTGRLAGIIALKQEI
ncbi:MAG TPA: peptidoglycan editing factor PgeF [Bacilli bacterium]|nr:peptidoglycan editing factor PgeF [Bacilli bacterium]